MLRFDLFARTLMELMKRIFERRTGLLLLSLLLSSCGGSSNSSLELLARLPLDGDVTDVWGYVDPASGKEYALVGFGNFRPAGDPVSGIHIVDVSDPRNPVRVASVTDVAGFDVKVWRNYAYVVSGNGLNGDGGIVDLTDPENPQTVGFFKSAHNIFITPGGRMFAETQREPRIIYDLNPDPKAPLQLWKGGSDGHDAAVIGNRWYDFGADGSTNIFDVSNPSAPRLLGSINSPNIAFHHSGWPTEDGNFLFITDEVADIAQLPFDFTIWDIRDPENPEFVTGFDDAATAHNLYIRGEFAYVSYYHAGFRIFDISDPRNPRIEQEFDTSTLSGPGFGGAFGVYPFAPSGNIYVSDGETGLHIFSFRKGNLTNQSNPLAP